MNFETNKDNQKIVGIPNLAGFLNGYVAGNIQFSSTVIQSHLYSIITNLENLKNNIIQNSNHLESSKSTIPSSLEETIILTKLVDLRKPDDVVEAIYQSFSKFNEALSEPNILEREEHKKIFRNTIFHYLNLAKQIKDSTLIDLVTTVADYNRKKLIDNA